MAKSYDWSLGQGLLMHNKRGVAKRESLAAVGEFDAPSGADLPTEFALEGNYPNPFNPSTTIRFDIQRAAQTDIAVFDILGRRIATLVGAQLAPGTYSTTWNGTNDIGLAVASGMYLVRMSALDEQGASFSAMKKIVVMK